MAQKTIVTHDGKFHADDVFAVATLLLFLNNEAEIVRTRDKEKIARADYVVDVGDVYHAVRNRFDHHQKEGAGAHPPAQAGKSGVPYAAFGLVWKHFGERVAGRKEVAERIDQKLVQPLDADDSGVALFPEIPSGVYPYELSDAVRAFVPTWREDQRETDTRFTEAVAFAQKILLREIELSGAQIEGTLKVEEAVRHAEDTRLIVLREDLPWKEVLAEMPEVLYVVHPQDGRWFVECVRDHPNLFVNRKDLPERWAGLREGELARVTDVPDAIFCHRNRFMAVARSQNGAIALARLALRANTK